MESTLCFKQLRRCLTDANPFAAEQAKCDETILGSRANMHVLKDSNKQSRLTRRAHRMLFCALQTINLILTLLPSCQILVNLPEIHGYLAYEGKQHKLVKSGSRSVREKAVSITLFCICFPYCCFLLLQGKKRA